MTFLPLINQCSRKTKENIKISSEELKELSQEIARYIAQVGRKYEKTETNMSRETLLIKIYIEALKLLITKTKWKKLFQDTLLTIQRK